MTSTNASNRKKRETARRGGEVPFSVKYRLMFAMLAVLVLVAGGAGWAAQAQLSGAVIAHGSVVVKRHVKKVQHRDGGIVAKINVKNGDIVKVGDVLIRLDATQTKAELGVIRSQLVELTGRAVRLAAVRDDLKTLEFPASFKMSGPEAERVLRGERRLFRSDTETLRSKKEQLGLRISQLKQEIKGLELQLKSKRRESVYINKELKQLTALYKKKLTSIARLYALERQAARIAGEVGNLEAQIARTKGQISEINLQILSIDQTSRTEAQRELRVVEAKISELREKRIAVVDRLNRIELRAPTSGVVHELAVHTIGGIVSAAEPVMLIVPNNEALTVEAQIVPTDIDQVKIGQDARLRFSAFSQRTTAEVGGKVVHISADITKDEKRGTPHYIARVEIDKAALAHFGGQKLLPGMPVEVFITTQQRTALSYLVKPISDQIERAFREE